MIGEYKGMRPELHESVFVAPGADIIGDVKIAQGGSVWFQTVVRGDVHWIRIGENTNIQDGSVLHVTNGRFPLSIGARVTVGHKVCLHGCTIEDDCLIGMGAVIMDGVVVGAGSIVAAGALLTPGKAYPPNSMIMGSPAKAVRPVTAEERAGFIDKGWRNYLAYVEEYRKSFRAL